MKRLLLPLALVGVLAGCTTPPLYPGPGNTPASAGKPGTTSGPGGGTGTPGGPCPRVEVGEGDAAMGLRALGIYLVNCGTTPYTVEGFPALRALDKDRRPLDVRVLHGVTEIAGPLPQWTAPPAPVVLEPGQRAASVVVWRNTYDDISHPPVDAPYLEITPAKGTAQVVTPAGALDLGSTGRLGVGPWRTAG